MNLLKKKISTIIQNICSAIARTSPNLYIYETIQRLFSYMVLMSIKVYQFYYLEKKKKILERFTNN